MTGLSWRKSSHSFANGNCAEVASAGVGILVRDSQLGGAGPVLAFAPEAWRAFTAALKA